MFFELVIFILIVVFFIIWKAEQKPKGIPPGEWGVPIFGYKPPSDVGFVNHLKDLQKKHGDVFCARFGRVLHVVLSNFEDAKKFLNGNEGANRPNSYTFGIFHDHEDIGIAFNADLEMWDRNRKFFLKHLKMFGMGKTYFQDVIAGEAKLLVEEFLNELEKPLEVGNSLDVAIINVIWQLVASKRYEKTDGRVIIFKDEIPQTFEIMQGPLFLMDIYPGIRKYVPRLVKTLWMKQHLVEGTRNHLRRLIQESLNEHEKDLDTNNPRDVIDSLLIDKIERKKSRDFDAVKEAKNDIANLSDIFGAGADTTSSTIRWFMLYMAKYPEIQEKIHKEIDAAIPHNTFPTLDDKERLPYLEATTNEVMRKISVIPTNLPHMVANDLTIGDYKIPKGSTVMVFNELIHNDPKYYEKPHEFYPEHFLDEEGNFVPKKDGFIPFSIGKRQCVGESLARMELFIFTSYIMQRFKLTEPPGMDQKLDVVPKVAFLNYPLPFKVVLRDRKKLPVFVTF